MESYKEILDYLKCNGKIQKDVLNRWKAIKDKYQYKVGIVTELDADFIDLLTFTDIRTNWRQRKVAYKIDHSLIKDLSDMKISKRVSMKCITKLPSNYFYVDYTGYEEFSKGNDGCLVAIDQNNKITQIKIVLLYDNAILEVATMNVMINAGVNDDNEDVLIQFDDAEEDVVFIFENGNVIFKERLFKKFVLNLLIYLCAINADIKTSERTISTYRKPKECIEPKNKFREFNEFDVGFVYSKQRKERIKYIHENKKIVGKTGSPKCVHYRQAHWNTYWIDCKDNKTQVIKWIEGMLINGVEAKNVNIKQL